MFSFGNRLKDLRLEKGIKQQEIADYLNTSRTNYSNYEREIHQPNFETLKLLAKYYDVTTDYLLGNTDLKLSPAELAFVNDIDLDNKELMKKFNLLVGDHKIDFEELEHWISIVKYNLKKRD